MRVRRRDLWRKFFADRGPHLAAMIAYFALLSFVPLTFLSLSVSAQTRYAAGFVPDSGTAYAVSIAVSLFGVFVFLVSCYYVLSNEDLAVRVVLPGAILATIFLEGTFQILPLYQRYADLN